MKNPPFYEGYVTDEVKLPIGRVSGQLIVAAGVPYIVSKTSRNESYIEEGKYPTNSKGVHYKLGGFIKVKKEGLRYLNHETQRMEDVVWLNDNDDIL